VRIIRTNFRFRIYNIQDTTFQGLIPYYFQLLQPGRALELNYCIWNNCNYPPKYATPENPSGECGSNQEDCEDCRLRPIEEIGSVHFTATCHKPWFCYHHESGDSLHNEKCGILVREWFKTRSAVEKSWGMSVRHTGTFYPEIFLGYCDGWGYDGYQRLTMPTF
jgi:hypothetical protein